MNQLSVIIITLNEERNISRCLDSVKEIADEIIVVDSYSSDNTEAICSKFGVRFIQTQWKGYAETKNYANSLASFDYIFSIDADEAVSDDLRQSILQFKIKGFTDAYSMNRKTNYCGKWINHSGWYPDTKLRIWNRHNAIWEGEVHETLKFNAPTKNIQLKGDLLHYSFYSIQEHITQINKYSEIAANSMYRKGEKTSLLKIILKPLSKFIQNYFIKGGFRDGYYGLIICKLSSYATFLRYIKLKERNK